MKERLGVLLFLYVMILSLANATITLYDFESGNLFGWTVLNPGGGVVITQEDKQDGLFSVKLTAYIDSKDYWNVQLETPQIFTTPNHIYKISFWAKASGGDGIIRLSTAASNQLTDEMGITNRQYLPELTIGSNWAKYTYEIVFSSGLRAAGTSIQLRIDAGKVANKTYFFDNLEIVDLTPDENIEDSDNTIPLAKDHSKFLGNILANNIPSHFETYWNQVTPENGGKWGSVEGQRNKMNWSDMDKAYNYAKTKGYKFKFHTFVWGSQEPNWITSLPQAEQKAEVEEFMFAVANRYPAIDYIDVVNEPLHQPSNIRNALGGNGTTGWDWIVWSFRKARELFPDSKLHINDYGIISDSNAARRYVEIVKILQKENLIDGIGIQCHEFNMNGVTAATMRNVLNILGATRLPIYVTELDISGNPAGNEESQYQLYREKFPVLWEHESVAGVTLWGYVTGATWKTGTGIMEANDTERKALKWLTSYMASEVSKVPNIFSETSNVKDINHSFFSIFPNPASDYLQIQGETVKNVSIFNALGRLMKSNIENGRIDIRSIERGIYMIAVEGEKGVSTVKFIKK